MTYFEGQYGAEDVEDSRGLRRIRPRAVGPRPDPSETEGIEDIRGHILTRKISQEFPLLTRLLMNNVFISNKFRSIFCQQIHIGDSRTILSFI